MVDECDIPTVIFFLNEKLEMGNEKFQVRAQKQDKAFQDSHFLFLLRCLELARIPGAAVEPNPRVGAVVVHGGRIIGEGAHEFYGGPHAEVNAIRGVKTPALLPDSTLYVSLEPCNHHGKTPPCTQLILDSGIKKVVVGAVDPNPQMGGKSIEFLRSQGVDVVLAADECGFADLNRHFEVNQREKRPYVVLKWSESADGFVAGWDTNGKPEPHSISCMEVNRHFHRLRHEIQAIAIGAQTAIVDNPSLTTRLWPGCNPVKILFDQNLIVPKTLQIFQGERLIVVNSKKDAIEGNAQYFKAEVAGSIASLLPRLYSDLKIGSILIEGGPNLTQQFLDQGAWDRIVCCKSPLLLGSGIASPSIPKELQPYHLSQVGTDQIYEFDLPSEPHR